MSCCILTIVPSRSILKSTPRLLRSIKNTEVLLQPRLGTIPTVPAVKGRFEQIEGGGRALLLRGHRIFSDCSIDADITSRIAKASATSGRLSRRLWNTRDVRLSIKLALYKAAVILVLPYNCETWTAYGSLNQATGQFSHEVPMSHCGDQLEKLGNKHQGAGKMPNPWY